MIGAFGGQGAEGRYPCASTTRAGRRHQLRLYLRRKDSRHSHPNGIPAARQSAQSPLTARRLLQRPALQKTGHDVN